MNQIITLYKVSIIEHIRKIYIISNKCVVLL